MGKKAESPSDMSTQQLECRGFRHQPRHVTDRATRGAGGQIIEFVRITQCNNCGTRIEATYSVPDFRVLRRKYIYPDNYSIKGGMDVFAARMNYLNRSYTHIESAG